VGKINMFLNTKKIVENQILGNPEYVNLVYKGLGLTKRETK
jgi:hypothetical protein